MSNYIVEVSHLDDEKLAFFGWVRIDQGEEFSLYWSPRYNETQPVSNESPRYLLVDDWNDANAMGGGGNGAVVIQGPLRH